MDGYLDKQKTAEWVTGERSVRINKAEFGLVGEVKPPD